MLSDNNLSTQLTSFFGDFSTLANNPTDPTQRSQVLQDGATIADGLQTLRTQVVSLQQSTNQQVTTLSKQANSLVQDIANLNKQIAGQGANAANSLHDQRDQDLSSLSKLMNINVVDQGDGTVNVLVGSTPVVQGGRRVGLVRRKRRTRRATRARAWRLRTTGISLAVSSGQIGGLVNASQNYLSPALSAVDTIASGLITAVNSIYSQGQGVTGFSGTLSGTTAVTDATAVLNAGKAATGISFAPTNGTFDLNITNAAGQTTTQQIGINLSGTGTQTTLNSLIASINTAGAGAVSASLNTDGTLAITSNTPGTTFSFGNDSSGVLASLGVNTFFSGSDATDIAVNSTLAKTPDYLATAHVSSTGVNAALNAQKLASAGTATLGSLGGKSVTDTYTDYIGNLAVQAQNASNNVTAQSTINSTLAAQQQSISGVSLDEETVNMMQYQRAFEGSARF